MNILDENILESQRQLLIRWRIPFRQIGYEIGQKGMDDEEILPLLLTLRQPTFFHDGWRFLQAASAPRALWSCPS